MSMLEIYNLKPYGMVYHIEELKLRQIFEDMVEKKTGIEIQLVLASDFETKALYVSLPDHEEERLSDEEWEKLYDKYNFEEWYETATKLLNELTGAQEPNFAFAHYIEEENFEGTAIIEIVTRKGE